MNWKEVLDAVYLFATGAAVTGLLIYGYVIARKVDRIVSNMESELNEPDDDQQESDLQEEET